ncbi:MAG: hypothetical protein Q9162_001865 [Coniocarpon cinnabarinum]
MASLGFSPRLLVSAPDVNPVNHKARSIPFLNPVNVYGRVFHFAWFGFMIAFWSWYAFPPLLNDVIAADIHVTKNEILISNIIGLTATLIIRFVSGPCCDRFGPRNTFAGILLAGAIPTFCSGGVKNVAGLYAIRFFVGILGGTFVPCQVWTTGFFDKNVVGTANALTGGFGNAGGGITYFVMPAIYNSLVRNQHETRHVAWRVSFIVPGILIVVTALAMLLCCPDTPTGKWSERSTAVSENMRRHSMVGVVDVPTGGAFDDGSLNHHEKDATSSDSSSGEKKDVGPGDPTHFTDHEAHLTSEQMLDTAKGEVVRKPSLKECLYVFASPQTFVTGACYFCSFGAELAINSILGNYYTTQFKPRLSVQESGNWAAMFGLLNVVFRPLGGFVADAMYKATGSVWSKKALLHAYGLITGAFLIVIGQVNSHDKGTMFGLVAGMAFFLEGGNGLNYALVPHVHPYANGIISGITGGCGNLGGIIFSVIIKEVGPTGYGKSIWIMGVISICVNVLVAVIPPIPKGQVGGR